MTDYYILDNHKPVAAGLVTWAKWFEQGADNRRVASTNIGVARVSTVFLGIDHRFGDEGPPILFETMVFNGPLDGEQERCSTWEQAEEMHAAMCGRVKFAEVTK